VERFVHFIAILAVASAVVLYFVAATQPGNDWLTAFIRVFIVVLVANIPEGLPATVTSCLTVAAKVCVLK
jgi:sodium/potassium-transporting ATPase subunit alpha